MLKQLISLISVLFLSQITLANSGPEALSNVSVGGGYPHKMDVLIPANRNSETTLLILLHGGGGEKAHYAHGLGIKKDKNKDFYDPNPKSANGYNLAFLQEHNLALVFIQGLAPNPNQKNARTWDNTIMDSGQDDVGLLKRVAWIAKQHYGFQKVVLGGHSMGGSMTNRMWCEASESFDAFISMAGPISPELWASCNPETIKPYMHVTGTNDRILQLVEDPLVGPSIDHHEDLFLHLDPLVHSAGGDAFVAPYPSRKPQFMNELVLYSERAQFMCNQEQGRKRHGRYGKLETVQQTNCGGKLKLIQVKKADHCIGVAKERAYKCDIPLNTPDSTAMLETIIKFLDKAL